MSLVKANGAGDQSTGFYNNVIDQSLRFDDGDSPRLSKTFGSGGSRTTFTYAAWVKRSVLTTDMLFLHSFGPTGFGIEGFLGFTSQDLLSFQFDYNSGNPRRLVSNQVFRDTGNWYHICVVADSTNSTSGDRLRMYINGIRETSFYDADYPSSGQNGTLNQAYSHYISGRTNNTSFFDGNLAEVNFLDGVAVTDTGGVLDEFIEIKNGVCIPKAVSGLSYGTTGFRFTFSDRSSQSALGTDTSGNSNNFAVSGLVDIDQSQDTPEINLATFNRLYVDYDSTPTYSAGNLRMDATSSSWFNAVSTISVSSGKWYVEFLTKSSTAMFVNVMEANKLPTFYPAYQDFGYAYYYTGQKWNNGSGSSYGDSYTNGDIIGVALDMDNGNLYFYKNGTVQNSGTAAFTGLSGDFVIGVSTSGTSGEWTANFGSDGSFNNRRGFGTNSDDNGIGQFVYAPPSGYLALCSANLDDTGLAPNKAQQAGDHFNTVIYTGDGASSNPITGVGFQPDWVWIKGNGSTNHGLHDSSRVISGNEEIWYTNSTAAGNTGGAYISSFDSDGFTVNNNTSGNGSGVIHAAWNWKATGGSLTSNSNGSITSNTQANTAAGLSIVTWTGNQTNGASVGHGLGVVPELVIIKNRDDTQGSVVNINLTSKYRVNFNADAANYGDFTYYNGTYTSDNIVFNNAHSAWNGNTDKMVAYVFHSVAGYSKLDTYTGLNASSNNTFIYTGFRPKFILLKNVSAAADWIIRDELHSGYYTDGRGNSVNIGHEPNEDNALTGGSNAAIDFVSNGFKIRGNDTRTGASNTYFYLAIADNPLKFNNAR